MSDKRVNVKALTVFSFLRGVGVATFQTLFPLYLLEIGYPVSDIGSLATLAMIPSAALLPLVGFLIDTVGRKPLIIITGAAIVLALLIPSVTTLYPLLLLAYTLNYFSMVAGQPSRNTMLADSVDPRELGVTFAKVATAFTIARSITPFIAGFSVKAVGGYSQVFQAGAVVALAGLVYFSLVSKETRRRDYRSIDLRREIQETLRLDRSLLWLYVFTVVDRFAWFMWWPMLNAHLGEYWGMGPEEVGVYSGMATSTIAIVGYVSGKLVDRIGYARGLILSEVVGAVSALGIALAYNKLVLALAVVGVGLSWSLWIPSYNSAVALNSRAESRGRAYSKMNAVRMGGSVPAPWLGGFMYDYVSAAMPFIMSSTLMIANTLYLLAARRRGKSNSTLQG